MKILLVTAGYSIYEAKGQLNGFLAHQTEKSLSKIGYEVKTSDVVKDTWSVDREVAKLLWADTIIYIVPIMWFNMPAPMVKWLGEVLLHEKTFVITKEYGEGGKIPADKFMIVTTSNLKKSDLGKGCVLKEASTIDDVLQPLIMTNRYLSIRHQIPTFHADNVVDGDTDWVGPAYNTHLHSYFKESHQ